MATRDVSRRKCFCMSDLNIVLLGGRSCGKSAIGNILLNKEEFVTRERITCSRRLGEVAGRWIAVVDTPGWWCDFSAQDTPQMVKREIIHSVSLCPPGPHVFLIIVKMSSEFSEKRRRALDEHLTLFTERVWSHCLVVFTCSVWPQHTTAEQHVGKGGPALQWLSERCCQRCHIIAFNGKPAGTQVTDLMTKIQELVTESRGRHFEMEKGILQDIAEEKRTIEERAQQRLMMMKKQKSLLQEEVGHLSEISVVLLGARGSGKSSSGNTIQGKGGSLGIRSRTARCITASSTVSGRHISVVDTPGWWMNYFADESPVFDRREILRSSSLCCPGPHALLLVIRVDRAFTETYRRAVQEHLKLLSETVWTHAIVLFSFGDWLGDTTIEQYIESEGEALQWLVEKCGNRYHVLNNKSTDGFQVSPLMEKIEEMVAGNFGRCYGMEGDVLHKLQERIRTEEEKGRARLARKQAQQEVTRSLLDKLNSPSHVRMILLGSKNTGKSSTGNTILGRKLFDIGRQTTGCVEGRSTVGGSTVTVLDTPGWLSADPYPPTAHTALLLLVNASSSFPLSLWEATQKHMEHFGESGWNRAVVLFAFGDWLGDTSIEQRIESEGEWLRRLVERCGNRYHVLDNKDWGCGAQVRELVELIEEMLVGERLEMLHKGAPRWKDVPAVPELHVGGAAKHVEDLNVWSTNTNGSSSDVFEAATSTDGLFHDQSRNLDVCGQVAVLPGELSRTTTPGLTFLSDLASLPQDYQEQRWAVGGRQTLVVNLPDWLVSGFEDRLTMSNGKSHANVANAEHKAVIFVAPVHQENTTRGKMLMENREGVVGIHSLCHPRLRERTLKKLVKSGGLQALIDQWGDSSVEELESFIDSYFEMVWKDTMESVVTEQHDGQTNDTPEQEEEEEHGREVLSSIDKKLSKLDLLEELQKDIVDLKQSVEHSWTIIQEYRDQSKGARAPSVQTGTEETDASKSSG